MRKYLLLVLIIPFVFLAMPVILPAEEPHITLRSTYTNLTVSQAQSMSNKSISKSQERGFYSHSTIEHNYNVKYIIGDKVVLDYATGLMRHPHGSKEYMNWHAVNGWIDSFNSRGYAGYHDWRLPTVEEAASLLEPSKKNGLYIAPVFSNRIEYIWTGDNYDSGGEWRIALQYGFVGWVTIDNELYVRPVRTIK